MKIVGYALALLLMLVSAANALNISEGQSVANFTATALDGRSVSLHALHGKTVVIVYWKTNQGMSLQALKDIKEVAGSFKKKGVQVIAVIPDSDNRDAANKIVRENSLGFPVVLDPERAIYGAYGIRVYPTTMIVDQDGKLAYAIAGHSQDYKKFLKAYLGKAVGELDDSALEKALSTKVIVEDHAASEMNRLYNLALKFNRNGMTDMAISYAGKAVAAKPEAVKAQILLGFLHLKNDDSDGALAVFEKALKAEPKSRNAMTGLGSALVEKGNPDRALTVLSGALADNPYPQWTYYELGRAYELKGDKDNAIKMYKKAMAKFIDEQVLPEDLSNCK